jgi:hypothetical protein
MLQGSRWGLDVRRLEWARPLLSWSGIVAKQSVLLNPGPLSRSVVFSCYFHFLQVGCRRLEMKTTTGSRHVSIGGPAGQGEAQ